MEFYCCELSWTDWLFQLYCKKANHWLVWAAAGTVIGIRLSFLSPVPVLPICPLAQPPTSSRDGTRQHPATSCNTAKLSSEDGEFICLQSQTRASQNSLQREDVAFIHFSRLSTWPDMGPNDQWSPVSCWRETFPFFLLLCSSSARCIL